MKVYRGPASTKFSHDSHALVARVAAEKIESAIKNNTAIKFNVSKEPSDRQAVGHIAFEDSDIVPMAKGVLARLVEQQELVEEIRKCLVSGVDDSAKITKIRTAMRARKIW